MKSALVCFIAVNNKVTESSVMIINPAFLRGNLYQTLAIVSFSDLQNISWYENY